MDKSNFEKLKTVVAALRDPADGCPWDLKQTHESLLKYLLEESYEFLEAVEEKNPKKMEEELGDILLQVLLHAQIAEENKWFNLESVSLALKDKLIRRHPHVFENKQKGLSAEDVLLNWEKIKEEERKNQEQLSTHKKHRIKASILNAPPLISAAAIGKKTCELKFDWSDYTQVVYKVEEEWQELKEELTPNRSMNKKAVKEELGDLLFSMAQLARHLEIDPHEALRDANKKFIRRFHKMEDLMASENVALENLNQEQMDVYWNQAKNQEIKRT